MKKLIGQMEKIIKRMRWKALFFLKNSEEKFKSASLLGSLVKGLQNYWPSNFENDLTPGVLESRQMALADSSAFTAKGCAIALAQIRVRRGRIILKV